MAQRYWIKRAEDGNEVVGTYFDSEAKAEAVAGALEDEAGAEYFVSQAPGNEEPPSEKGDEDQEATTARAEAAAERRLDERRERTFDERGYF
ncbi:hypothetical protein [Halorhabdus rudnickae]|uniref:hypothetical protein n=1 Tax=Halorhabdus rudnickae TaxID=1775544 RepID=UPI001082A91F|nr:hypothetical protein [Halorhabdus rudnickae]